MNFSSIANIVIPEGEVFSISAGGQTLWTKGSEPTPVGPLPPDNQIWYEATAQISNSNLSAAGTIVNHTWDSTTGKGVVIYENVVTNTGIMLRNVSALKKLWFPNSLTTVGNGIKSCANLEEIYFGSNFAGLGLVGAGLFTSDDGISALNNLKILKAYNNPYFEDNDSALVSTTSNPNWSVPTLARGTIRTDLRNSACQVIGRRCICDTLLTGTLYFGANITAFAGDYDIGTDASVYTMYWYPTTAPTPSHTANIRCNSGTIVHIPVGSLSSYETTWGGYLSSFNKMTFVEDL